MSKFNPQEHITNMKGKDYLEVKWRLVWFKDENPKGEVVTEVISTTPAIVKAIVRIDGATVSTGHGSAASKANAVWSGREIEKAETAAIGRALAHAGYGTQFTEDTEDDLADAPIEKKQPAAKTEMTLNDALKVKDAKGILYGDKADADLQRVIDSQEAPAEKRNAARLILESRKEGVK